MKHETTKAGDKTPAFYMPLFALRKPQNDVLGVVRYIPLHRRFPRRIDALQIAQIERGILK